ncbi:hypothetical protein J6590_020480 [Homalodisca vitripennis]|nr:hypothetical protein J6590_020480 [Homalodisca vitripennis]
MGEFTDAFYWFDLKQPARSADSSITKIGKLSRGDILEKRETLNTFYTQFQETEDITWILGTSTVSENRE